MHDHKSISFTDQCVCLKLNHIGCIVCTFELNCLFTFFFFAGSGITQNARYLVSPLKKASKQSTFTETEQSFFRTLTILFNGEETILVAWTVSIFRTSCYGMEQNKTREQQHSRYFLLQIQTEQQHSRFCLIQIQWN